jgi:hypothetical protein
VKRQIDGATVVGTRHVAKGDVFIIPAGIPRWFKEAEVGRLLRRESDQVKRLFARGRRD